MPERSSRPKRMGTRSMQAKDRNQRLSRRQGRAKTHPEAPAHGARDLQRGPEDLRHRTFFDGFAEAITRVVSSAYFFAFCLAGVVGWALFGPPLGFSNTWQLVINTATTILTFLMVAVLQNSSRRGERAIQAKLDAIADALADFMDKADIELDRDVEELEAAVGLEERVGSS